jgi:hypothetical protein
MIGIGLMLGTVSFAQDTTGGPKMAPKKAKKAKKSKTTADTTKK